MTNWTRVNETIEMQKGYRFGGPALSPRHRVVGAWLIYLAGWSLVLTLAVWARSQFGEPMNVMVGALVVCDAIVIRSLASDLAYIGAQERAELERVAPVVERKVMFPPVEFCRFVWNYRDERGSFPSITETINGMEQQDSSINRTRIQAWYQLLVDAGALTGRREGGPAGEPAEGWDRERYIRAAIDAATMGQE